MIKSINIKSVSIQEFETLIKTFTLFNSLDECLEEVSKISCKNDSYTIRATEPFNCPKIMNGLGVGWEIFDAEGKIIAKIGIEQRKLVNEIKQRKPKKTF